MTTQCLFYHPQDEQEKQIMTGTLAHFERINDMAGILVYTACISKCRCGYDPEGQV